MSETMTHEVLGLAEPAEIVIDRWGVPHIRAASRRDLFFVQGFNAARDRLWQLDIWRKRGLGLLAGDFGPGYLAQDRAARLFLYRGDMEAEWDAYGVADLREIVGAFVEGLNAYVALVDGQADLAPPEFAATGTAPARWRPEDVLRIRSHAIVANAPSEAARAQVLAKADLEIDLVRRSIDPPHRVVVPDGFDPTGIDHDTLDMFRLATAPVTFTPERLAASLAEAWRWSKVDDLGEVQAETPEDGSNNWAVAPSRTATGRPILASDPHRAYLLPSLRYVVHLSAPDLDVIGAGEPALPGVSFGHNGHSAFSMTIFPADQEDLYVYETDAADPDRFRYGEGYERFEQVRETIPVKGSPDQEVVLKFSRHGPVIQEDPGRHRAVALRTVWREPGTAAYLASVGAMEARTPAAYRAALRHWGAPGANHVYADEGGHVAWFVAGKAPRRLNWDGLLPVPGDGRYEWDGFHDPADLPHLVDPPCGFVWSANEMNMPPDYPIEDRKLGFEFMEPSRARRIREVLERDDAHTLAAAMALQTDDLSIPARRVLALLPDAFGNSEEADEPLKRLVQWDCGLSEGRGPAALFEVWWTRHLKPALLARAGPAPGLRALLAPGDHETLLEALEQPGRHHWLPDLSARESLIAATLAAADCECRVLLGPDPQAWAWGSLHHGYFAHPMSVGRPGEGPWRGVGPLPKGGSGSSVMNTRYRASDFRAVAGASFRMVLDVGNWDATRFINSPGQSGDPRSPHYDDLAPIWARREYRPLLYSRDAVDREAITRIRLVPPTNRSA